MGGLGNQMFQYAAGRALAMRLGVPLKLDLSWFDTVQNSTTPREYMLHAFPIEATAAILGEVEGIAYRKQNFFLKLLRRSKKRSQYYVKEPLYNYWAGFNLLTAPVYLDGYWQQQDYFVDITNSIRKDFVFPAFTCREAEDLAAKISVTTASVCIHIRRGDYAVNPIVKHVHGLCTPEYYTQALKILTQRLGKELSLFIFTDDPAWVRKSFDTQGYPTTMVDFPEHQDKPWDDMHLMSCCTHHIIANSSFSWWGAWLSLGCGMVVAPKNWFAVAEKQNDTPVPIGWIKI